MFIVTINGVDASSHTKSIDADVQKERFENMGETNVVIVEKDTFEPIQPS